MHTIQINEAQCKKDGICVAECPAALFLDGPDGVPVLAEGAGELCINCGHCIAVCPGAAISVNGINYSGHAAPSAAINPNPWSAMSLKICWN